MIDPSRIPQRRVRWRGARRIIRSIHPPIDLFEDIADPADWPLLLAAEQKTNPRLMESLGALDLVPPSRRVGGPGASWLMAPFTHVSTDRPSRFTDGTYGVLYLARRFGTALLETMHHHARFMARTHEPPGWTSQFRELVLELDAGLHDLRGGDAGVAPALDPDDYGPAQALGRALRTGGSDGVVYPSVREPGGECAGLFYPDVVRNPVQGRHLDYHWDGTRVDLYRDAGSGEVFRVAVGR
ncbi:RES family NAD+ phosphorylase [Elioraea sp.]|uniref:RES family NAD+ phosphorylase n=1 Tax=Elioraea sp. TaxID=2185103 RepID=UPI003F6FB050